MKFFLKWTAIAVCVAFLYNCSNESENANSSNVEAFSNSSITAKIPTAIYSDATFVEYITAAYADSKLLKDNAKLKLYMADNELSNAEMVDIHTVLGYNSYNDLTNYTTAQAQRAAYLDRTYGISSLTEAEKLEVFETGFTMNIVEFSGRLSPRARCRLQVNSEVVIMHLGCVAGDFTVVAGILCHAAVSVYQYASLEGCNELPNT